MSKWVKKHLILAKLSDGQFHSGEQLGDALEISRAAVAKHIKGLEQFGLDIYKVSGKGYRLSKPLILLDSQQIMQAYERYRVPKHHLASQQHDWQELPSSWLEVHHVIDSTNDWLLNYFRDDHHQTHSTDRSLLVNGHTIVAECQTAGRGRRGRQWISPFGSHIYFSYLWYLDHIGQAMGLSIAIGLALRETISEYIDEPVKLKWPNDVYIKGKKVAGILVELEELDQQGRCAAVIGIGVNINMPLTAAAGIEQAWTDLSRYASQPIDRNDFVAKLCKCLYEALSAFVLQGLRPLVPQWIQYDHFYQQMVVVIIGNYETKGVCKGIDHQGGLVLQLADGELKSFYGGEISLRGQ